MWELDYDEQAKYWIEKEAASNRMEREKLHADNMCDYRGNDCFMVK